MMRILFQLTLKRMKRVDRSSQQTNKIIMKMKMKKWQKNIEMKMS